MASKNTLSDRSVSELHSLLRALTRGSVRVSPATSPDWVLSRMLADYWDGMLILELTTPSGGHFADLECRCRSFGETYPYEVKVSWWSGSAGPEQRAEVTAAFGRVFELAGEVEAILRAGQVPA
jgi:hypothetical protein